MCTAYVDVRAARIHRFAQSTIDSIFKHRLKCNHKLEINRYDVCGDWNKNDKTKKEKSDYVLCVRTVLILI